MSRSLIHIRNGKVKAKAHGKVMGCELKIGTASGRIRTIKAINASMTIIALRIVPNIQQCKSPIV